MRQNVLFDRWITLVYVMALMIGCIWHGLDALQGTRAKPGNHLVLYKIGGFTPDKSRNNFLHAQTMASAILFESLTIILATVQRKWQCISWLYIGSTKELHVTGYTNVSKNMGAFRCIHARNPSSPSWLNEVKVDLNGHCALIG